MTAGVATRSLPGSRVFMVLAALLAVRVLHTYLFGWHSVPAGSDGESYQGYALAVLNRADWLTNPDFTGNYRPPVYPLFVALIYLVFGEGNLLAVFWAQALVGTATVYFIFRLSSSVFGVRNSYLALFWGGLYYFYLWYEGTLLRETLIYFFIILAFYWLWLLLTRKRGERLIRSGPFWGFAVSLVLLIHTDARYLIYVPCISALFVIYRGIRGGIRDYAVSLLVILGLMTPWAVRNYVAYDGFVLVNTRTLDLRGSDATMRLNLLSTKKMTEVRSDPHWLANLDYPTQEERAAVKRGENPRGRPEYEVRMIVDDVYPATTFLGRKLFYARDMWVPFNFSYRYSPFPEAKIEEPWSARHNAASILFYGTILPFAAFGVLKLLWKRDRAVWFLVFPIFVQAALHFMTFGLERYRTHIDSFIIIIGCWGIVQAAGSLLRRKETAV